MTYPIVLIAGVTSGVGKTTITIGLIAALKRRGFKIQPFKAGPDYIDPSFHTLVSGQACRNLDAWMLSENDVLELFERQARSADMSIIEGVMGLYDGLRDKEDGSSAHLSKILRSPVILIVDAGSMSRSAGAVVLGYKNFDRNVDIKGVILNNIGTSSHYESVRHAIESRTGIPVLGFLPKDSEVRLAERHLGLIPAEEKVLDGRFINRLASLIEKNIDMFKVTRIIRNAAALPSFKRNIFGAESIPARVTIAIARDRALNFYYEDNLDILRHHG